MKYYELNDDINFPNRWYLGDILDVDNWTLSTEAPAGFAYLTVELERDGQEIDFTLTEAYSVPIISAKVRAELNDIAGIEFIPVVVLNKQCNDDYFALIISQKIECIDEENSEFQKFEENDPVRPDKAGDYRAFMKLRLDKNKIVDTDLFRLKKFEIAVIASEKIKDRFETIGTTGIVFKPVV